MLVWFATLGLLGLAQIVQSPGVLAALDPSYARGAVQARRLAGLRRAWARSCWRSPGRRRSTPTWATSAEAPIRLAWFGLVLPALVLNYFGQGALLLREPEALEHPFYHLAPGWLLWPLIGLATLATVIASQAVISGVFSLTGQAIQLGHLSRGM